MLFNHFHDVVALFPLLLIGLDKAMLDNKKGLFALAVALCAITNYFFFIGQVVFLILYFIIKLITKEYKLNLKKFIHLAIESLIGVGISAIIFIPSILFVLGNPRVGGTWQLLDAILPKDYQIVEILRGMLLGPDIMTSRGLFCEYLFTSAEVYLPFVGIILFASYMWKKPKNWISILLITCFIFMIIPILNSSFFAFATSYYARWFYMPILIMSLATIKALEENIKLEHGYITAGLLLGIFLFITLAFSLNENQIVYHESYVIINAIIVLFGYIGLYSIYKFKNNKKLFTNLLLLGVIISTFLNGFVFFYKYNKLSDPIYYNEYYINNDLKLDYLNDGERTDSNNSVTENLGYLLNIPNLRNFNTTISSKSFEFYNSIGIDRVVKTIIGEDNPKVRDFLSTKYIITTKDEILNLDLVETNNKYNVYKNNNYVSLGIPYKYYIKKDDYNKLDYETRKDLLIYAVVLEDKQINKYNEILEEIDLTKIERLNNEYENYIESLKDKTSTNFKYTKQGAKFNISSNDNNFIVLSIPYDEGWNIKVNDKDITFEEVDNGLIGFKINSGNNKIILEYKTPGLNIGICISVISTISLVLYTIIDKRKVRG